MRHPWGLRVQRFPEDVRVTQKAMSLFGNPGGLDASLPVTVVCTPRSFSPVMRILWGLAAFDFKQLVDLTAVDYPSRQPRFEVVYQLLSVRYGIRCRVKLPVGEGEGVPSVSGRYASALWAEREAYDMFGVPFEGHPDLRRLLTDYGFEGHPLRKDFPLTGYTEVRYDEAAKRVVSEPVERSQDIRSQETVMTWQPLPDATAVKVAIPTPKTS